MIVDLTIYLPDKLRREVAHLAAARGETISDLVSEALARYFAELLEESDDAAAVEEIEARLSAGQEQTLSWDEVRQDLDGLPD
ncbi:MAG: CopG family transcriptional regulator [Chloroflexales bacterium]